MPENQQQLRESFNSAADLYQRARPEYPTELFDVLVDSTGIDAGSALLEVGCASGKATLPLARRGFHITAIEIGTELATAARRNLADYPNVHVANSAFELWSPDAGRFDLVFAATAWHWMNPVTRYQRAWELLRPGKYLAFWSALHVIPEGGDPFFTDIQNVYATIGASSTDGDRPPRPGELRDHTNEISTTGLFDNISVRHFDWEVTYTADEYIELLDTFSGHITMDADQRNYLYSEIRRRLGQRSDGRLRRHCGAALHIARRIDRATATPPRVK